MISPLHWSERPQSSSNTDKGVLDKVKHEFKLISCPSLQSKWQQTFGLLNGKCYGWMWYAINLFLSRLWGDIEDVCRSSRCSVQPALSYWQWLHLSGTIFCFGVKLISISTVWNCDILDHVIFDFPFQNSLLFFVSLISSLVCLPHRNNLYVASNIRLNLTGCL